MRKIEKTKEEKKAIKNYKEEEKHIKMGLEKEKKPIRKEHFYLIGAFLILILLIAILVYMIFFSKSRDVIVPDLPSNESLDIGIVDFNDKASTADDLNSKKNSNIAVTYNLVSDYYKEGILLSNTQADYLNNSFVITSGPLSENPFISVINKNGKLEWLTKLNDKEYGKINVYKTIFINKNYYIFGSSKKNDKTSLIAIKVQDNGKVVTTKNILSDFEGKIKDVIATNNKIAVITSNSSDIKVVFTNEELKESKNEVTLSKYIDNSSYLNYQTGTKIDDKIKLVVNNSLKFYTVLVEANSASAVVEEMTDLNNLKTEETIRVNNYLDGFAAYTRNQVYKFDANNKLINKFDYSKIKLEDDAAFKEKYKDDEFFSSDDLTNEIYVEEIKNDEESLIVNTKTLFSSIYDIYDSTLKISKRIMLDSFKYSYPEGMLLNSFYIDGAIYEVYSYGSETPSIMISRIG